MGQKVYSLLNEIYKMGFINQLLDLYSNLYNFGYIFQAKKGASYSPNQVLHEGSSTKLSQDLLPLCVP